MFPDRSPLGLCAFVTFLMLAGLCAPLQSQPVANDSLLSASRQLVVVTSADWTTVPGILRRFERDSSNSPWRATGTSIPIGLGRNGLAWGLGLHRNPEQAVLKREGDAKSPAGIFKLSSAFGMAEPKDAAWIKLPYQQLLPPIECVDDAKSAHYGSIVNRDTIALPDWNSAEKMSEYRESYRLGIVVDHNAAPVKSEGGSCVFLHIGDGSKGSAGCTVMSSAHVEVLLRWLDPDAAPRLVQLPETEYATYRSEWRLPAADF